MGIETLAIGALVGSAGLSAFGAIQSGYAQQEQADYNASVAEGNAAAARQAAALDERNIRKKNALVLGTIRARAAANQGDLGGSALDVLADSAAEAELEALTARYGGEVAARRYESEAAFMKTRGKSAVFAGYTGAASALLQGAAGAYKTFGPATSSGGGIPTLAQTVPNLRYGGPR